MAAGGDEVEVAANASLRRMDVAEVVRAIDDPELAVAGGEVENLLVIGQDDERRKAQLGMDRNDVFLAVLDDASTSVRARGLRSGEREQMPAKSSAGNTCRLTVIQWDCMMFSLDLNSSFLRISFVEPTRDRRREKHNRGEEHGEHGGAQLPADAKAFEDFDETGNHVPPPAR